MSRTNVVYKEEMGIQMEGNGEVREQALRGKEQELKEERRTSHGGGAGRISFLR